MVVNVCDCVNYVHKGEFGVSVLFSEQHYLSELQNLGLLSYTPSREVQGKRINSYDDRLDPRFCHTIDLLLNYIHCL